MDKFRLYLHPHGVTLVLPEADKIKGINRIAEKGNISLGDLIYVGDAMSDYKCLRMVSFPACPSNADERVKSLVRSKGGYVSDKRVLEGSLDILINYAPIVDSILKRAGKRGLYAVVYDFDGCLFDKYEVFTDPGQKKYIDQFNCFVRDCEGPFSRLPFLTINTGASVDTLLEYTRKRNFPILEAYGFAADGIPEKYHKCWPPMMFEDGLVSYSPISGEWVLMVDEPVMITKIKALTERFERLLSAEIEKKEIRIPPKDASLSVDYLPFSKDREKLLKEFHERMIGMFSEQEKSFGYVLEVLR